MVSQVKFITDIIKTYKVCKLPKTNQEITKQDIQNICQDFVSKILSQKFINAPDMKAVMCMFDTLISSHSLKRNNIYGLYDITGNMDMFCNITATVDAKTIVYMTNILSDKIQVVIKKTGNIGDNIEILREYFIGIKAVNSLRYSTPIFAYVLGGFVSKHLPHVIYEKSPGPSLYDIKKDKKIDFNEWLVITVQLLLGLEVAQRKIGFTHYDLHNSNVLIRTVDNISYDIPMDNVCYSIKNVNLIPVIIDYGYSCAYINNNYIGSDYQSDNGIYHYMIPGFDLYRYIANSINGTTPQFMNEIMDIFEMYKPGDDPYKIYKDRTNGYTIAAKQYCKKVSTSRAATYTPLMAAKWLMKKYPDIGKHITISTRKMYLPLQYSNTPNEYYKIFDIKPVPETTAKLIESCMVYSGYVITKYNLNVLEKYNENLKIKELQDYTSSISKLLLYKPYKDRMVNKDLQMLQKVFDIAIPTQSNIDSVIEKVLKLSIKSTTLIKQSVMQTANILEYHTNLQPYLDFYYMMLETESQDYYSDWVSAFLSSVQYQFYIKNLDQVTRAIRWLQTIMGSIHPSDYT